MIHAQEADCFVLARIGAARPAKSEVTSRLPQPSNQSSPTHQEIRPLSCVIERIHLPSKCHRLEHERDERFVPNANS